MGLVPKGSWTLKQFLAWEEDQPIRYEYIGAVVRRVVDREDRALKVQDAVRAALRRRLVQPHVQPPPELDPPSVLDAADLSDPTVFAPSAHWFVLENLMVLNATDALYPDLIISAQVPEPTARVAADPILVIDVPSPQTLPHDLMHKVGAYQMITSMQHIIIIDAERPWVKLWNRHEGQIDWVPWITSDIGQAIHIRALGLSIDLADIYALSGSADEPSSRADDVHF